jgi:hypothetical protein
MKYYRYIIYRLHDFFSKKDNTPIADTILVMIIIHFFQIFTILLFLSRWFDTTSLNIKKGDIRFIAFIGLLAAIYYFFVFHNGKWKNWIKGFKKESAEERMRSDGADFFSVICKVRSLIL